MLFKFNIDEQANFHSIKDFASLFFIVPHFWICKNEVILIPFQDDLKNIARISGYLLNTINILIATVGLSILFLAAWFTTNLFNLKIEPDNFAEASNNVFKTFIFNEINKFFLIWIFLYDEAGLPHQIKLFEHLQQKVVVSIRLQEFSLEAALALLPGEQQQDQLSD